MSLPTSVVRAQSNAVSKATLRVLPPIVYAASSSSVCATTPTIASKSTFTISNLSSHQELPPVWFNSSFPRFDIPFSDGREPESERKVKLGKTLRILQERLPTLLQSPLPQEILSPHISLHLFPTTHPYLPTVSGRVAYIAALWTSPLVWNRVPIIGNVQLEILSERMVSQPYYSSPKRPEAFGEQLVVKWRTAGSKSKDGTLTTKEDGEQKLDDILRGTLRLGEKKTFTGLFIFEFDKDARVISHTIEHVDEHGDWEKGLGAKVVGLTDWLLGGIKGRSDGGAPALCEIFGKDKKNGR
ncbi:uncharacterized protein GGS22DRAFT_145950 [Annulohypoxylon maeteangense]|uniref:uncharacterized protein n=1 Tax=Annulohypoxylon maeteangense TaxID=1927788 RepID=UPI00200737CE|nr:uncharacterized protein GGS22DRAFT_145950 [Annulohypoxylon maeteangense]KAI0884698.1 hypothetical protein GGS22DRAFT_145950 [Annulohypoxylon maeteangense]